MHETIGRAVVTDFDGTIARLDVPWAALRARLGVQRIDDLWEHDAQRWDAVTAAEVDAARHAEPVPPVVRALEHADRVAVLSSNAEAAIETFLARLPELQARVCIVVGRTELGGPKTTFDVFASGYQRCLDALATRNAGVPVTYVGDMEYELEFARRLGAHAVAVTDVGDEQ